MTIIWFIVGICIIFGISRYNESNALFWALLFSFVMGFAGKKMVDDSTHRHNNQDGNNLTQVYSTQAPAVSFTLLTNYINSDTPTEPEAVTVQTFVGKSIPAKPEIANILNDVYRRTRDQPPEFTNTS